MVDMGLIQLCEMEEARGRYTLLIEGNESEGTDE